MKRFLFIISSILIVSSCLNDGSENRTSYTMTASFQYKEIKFRPDSTFVNTTTPEGFGYDMLNFYHQLDADKIWFDGGFILSCAEMPESGVTDGLENKYRVYLAPDNNKDQSGNIYTVFYQNPDPALMPSHDISFVYKDNGTCVMHGCYVTNTVEVAEFAKQNFKAGDRMTLKATGFLNGVKTGEADFPLVDFSAQKDSIVSKWTLFDLSKLGNIEYVDFEISSSNPDTPAYFCMDSLGASIELVY